MARIRGRRRATVSMFTIPAGTTVLYDQTKAVKSGSVIPIKVQLVDAVGRNVSSLGVIVQAVRLLQVATSASEVINDAGSSTSDDNFRFDPTLGSTGGYIFNLKTTGYGTGSYLLNYTVGGDPSLHSLQFQVRQ